MRSLRLLILAIIAFAPPGVSAASEKVLDANRDDALAASQAAVGRVLDGYVFRDRTGKRVSLSDFRGRPVIVNLIYTACNDFCPTIVESLARAVDGARDAIGADGFTVLTIGFDTITDNPAQMRAYAKLHRINHPRWRFLSTDAPTIAAFTREIGFTYRPASHGFDHIAQTTVLDGGGRVVRQIYGADIRVSALVEPLRQIRYGETANLISFDNLVERIRLFCTLYDPDEDAYAFDWSFFTGIIVGLISIAGLTAFLVHAVLQRRRPGSAA